MNAESVIKENMVRRQTTGRQPDESEIPFITREMLVGIKRNFEAGMSRVPKTSLLFILLNVLVFIWELATGALTSTESLIAAGALSQEHVLLGEIWRLFSCTLLHGSFQHLLSNCVVLYILGLACEHIYGSGPTVLIYAASGLCGSILSVSLQPGPSVGASGAVFGVMAAVIFFFYRHKETFYLRDNRIGIVLGVYAFFQFMTGALSPYIDNLAHLGGFIGGVTSAMLLKPVLPVRHALETASPAGPTAAPRTFPVRIVLSSVAAVAAGVLIVWMFVPERKAAQDETLKIIAPQSAKAEQVQSAGVSGVTLRNPDGNFENNGDITIYGTVVNESREVKSWQVVATLFDETGAERTSVRMVNGIQQWSPEEYQTLVTKRNISEADLQSEELKLTPGSAHKFVVKVVEPPAGMQSFTIEVK